jgi:sugar lactone lactonase YvrE
MMMRSKRTVRRVVALLGAVAVTVTGVSLISGNTGDAARRPAASVQPLGGTATFTSVFKSTLGLEGLTGDNRGNLYSAARGGDPCPVWRVPISGGAPAVVGNIPAPCNPSGIAFNSAGRLFVGDGDEVLALTPSASNPPTATVFAAGVPGANGLAFDRNGALWVSDGVTGQGRVWKVGADGVPAEMFRVQPMVNEVNLVDGVGGVGRDPRALPPGTVTVTPTGRAAANTLGSQHLVANGLAFSADGTLFVGDTARGAIWKVDFDESGRVRSPVGCDTTFTANTLCLDNIVVAHPYLDGADGIALDRAGTIWVAVNERNAIVAVTARGRVVEVARNEPAPATRLRNEGPLEFPTSPFLNARTLCLAHSDGSRRDNFPNSGGEVGPEGPELAKISCLDQRLDDPGLPLPVR